MSDDERKETEKDGELRRVLEHLDSDAPPPDPPVEAMWAVIREELPSGAPRRGRRRAAPGLVWVPALLAAGVAGLVVGRWSAPPAAPPATEVAEGTSTVEADTPIQLGGGTLDGGEDSSADPSGSGRETEAEYGLSYPVESETSPPEPLHTELVIAPEVEDAASEPGVPPTQIRFATNHHLLQVGPLLTRLAGGADPEAGTVPDEIRDQARVLLAGTRFLLADPEAMDAGLVRLLEDLEFLLTQVVTLPEPDSGAARVEIELIAEGMSEQRILPRIHNFAHGGADQ